MEAQFNRTVYQTKIDKVAGVMQYHDLSSKVYNIVNEKYTYPQMVKRGVDPKGVVQVHINSVSARRCFRMRSATHEVDVLMGQHLTEPEDLIRTAEARQPKSQEVNDWTAGEKTQRPSQFSVLQRSTIQSQRSASTAGTVNE